MYVSFLRPPPLRADFGARERGRCRKGTNGVSSHGATANLMTLTEGLFGYPR